MGGTPKTPKAPDASKSYQQGVDVYLQNEPTLLNAEQDARDKYDAPSIQANIDRQNLYGSRATTDALSQLNLADPIGQRVRAQMGAATSADLANGYGASDAEKEAIRTAFADAAGSRGVTGVNPKAAGNLLTGTNLLQDYERRLGNNQKFLAGPTPQSQIALVPQVQPDRSPAYVNMNAGYQGQQLAQAAYSNTLAQPQDLNWWQRSLKGASIGASEGGTFGGGYGAIFGAAGGAIDGAANGPIYQAKTGTG